MKEDIGRILPSEGPGLLALVEIGGGSGTQRSPSEHGNSRYWAERRLPLYRNPFSPKPLRRVALVKIPTNEAIAAIIANRASPTAREPGSHVLDGLWCDDRLAQVAKNNERLDGGLQNGPPL